MKKKVFLAGWDVRLNGDIQCNNYIATQITTEEVVKNLTCGLELIFENEKLVEAFDYEEGTQYPRLLLADEKGFSYPDYQPNNLLQIVETQEGLHQLGGEVPSEFKLPESNSSVPFQYFGFISNEDANFNWLPFHVHLICPIYLNIEKVFLDYTFPYHPTIINKLEIESAETVYEENIGKDSEIVFEEVKYNFHESLKWSQYGHAGVPIWKQFPKIPVCPKSGKLMKLLCQLDGTLKVKRSNIAPNDDWDEQYFEELDFSEVGSLYIFFEPSSQIACYLIQNS
ncbi:hypothetical protein [Flectobacillus roseus]|uniref:hypothetical protein n=1 Tax=Flectobacillus roseus TaxID=502259 RepID=UPI0024B7D5F4|nr:hypothetical protein [Flectobacillus roseus]MDI9871896.1 hypothetical protein [Flectobacillus roseus]